MMQSCSTHRSEVDFRCAISRLVLRRALKAQLDQSLVDASTPRDSSQIRLMECQYHAAESIAIWRISTRLSRLSEVRQRINQVTPIAKWMAWVPVIKKKKEPAEDDEMSEWKPSAITCFHAVC